VQRKLNASPVPSPDSSPTTANRRVVGLDAIRFVSASIVLLGHLGLATSAANHATGVGQAIHGLLGCLFNGPAAVIVFFVVSGFCIHYPFRKASQFNVAVYLSRRVIRVGVPSLAFIAYSLWVLKNDPFSSETVLWSILCEIIYYCLYPLLVIAARYLGWRVLVAATFMVAFGIGLTHLKTLQAAYNGYTAMGAKLTWLIGLPCWLLGGYLADNFQNFRLISPGRIWALRSIVFACSVLLRISKFHVASPLASNCFTLNLFAILVFYWIGYEIAYCSHQGPSRWLESAGAWSYSIYLVHPLAASTMALIGWAAWMSRSMFTHFLGLVVVYASAYAFYLLVERPSHRFATKFCKVFKESPMWVLTVRDVP
jgi:peptidoglycan/LPS O-acetylase OafA/YrhL